MMFPVPTEAAIRCSLYVSALFSVLGLRSRHELTESDGIGRGGTLLVIVEISKDVAALTAPGLDALCPGGQGGFRIIVLVAAAGAVSAHIDEVGGALPRRRRIMMVG